MTIISPSLFQDFESIHIATRASIAGRIAFGPNAAQKATRLGSGFGYAEEVPMMKGKLCCTMNGFSLHAARATNTHNSKGLEQLIFYISRGPFSNDRLTLTKGDMVKLALKRPFSDGFTHLLMTYSEFSKDVGVSAKTINDWLSILEASNQISLLEAYYTNLGKRLVKSPKLYFNDVGLLCFLLGLNKKSVSENYLIGAIWETYIYGEMRKGMRIKSPEGTTWFYRDQSREVDFLIEKGLDAHITVARILSAAVI